MSKEKITIDLVEIRKAPKYSITDPEVIRQITLHGIQEKDDSLLAKVHPEYLIHGLYPTKMKVYNITPDRK